MPTCARFDVEDGVPRVDGGLLFLGFIIGLLIGFLLTFLLLWIFCFHMKFKSRSYNTYFLSKIYWSKADNSCGSKFANSATCLDRTHGKIDPLDDDNRRESTASSENSMRLRRRKSSSPSEETHQLMARESHNDGLLQQLDLIDASDGSEGASSDCDALPMIDAVTQITEQAGEQELLRQDWTATGHLERDLWRSRLMGLWQLAGAVINQLANRSAIEEATRRQLLCEHTDQLTAAKAKAEADIAEDRRLRREATAKARTKEAAAAAAEAEAEAAEAEESRRAEALDSAAQAEMARLARRLGGLAGLQPEEADAAMASLKAGVAKLESRLAAQRLRQCGAMEESLARRRQLLGRHKAADEEAAYGMELLMESRRQQLAGMVRDKKLAEGDAQRLMGNYQKALLKQKEAFEKSYLAQQGALAQRLRHARRSQSAELEQRHAAEVTRLTRRVEAGTETEPERVLNEFAGLLEERLARRTALSDELDRRDCNQVAALRDDLLQEKLNGEARAEEELGAKLGLSEEELGRLMDVHRRQVEKFKKNMRSEQQRAQRKLEEKLARRQATFAAAAQAREAELVAVKRGQDAVLAKALNLQLGLDEQSRRQIVEEHERQLAALGSNLQLSRLRQEKGLEAKLAARRANMAKMRREAREAQLAMDEQRRAAAAAKAGAGEDVVDHQLEARLDEERRRLAAESRAGRERLRDRLAEGTSAALRRQEAQLGAAIGRLQTGQARRRGVIDKQEKALQQLEAELEAKMADAAGGGSRRGSADLRGLDQILQSHKNQVASLTDQMDREKRQQEMLLQERLQKRKIEREDEVKETVDREEQEATRALDRSGHGKIARYVLEMSLDAKFRNSMLTMEEDMRLEMLEQQEKMDREMEDDLQKSLEEQRKRLFGELARLTSIPKAEVQAMIDRAGANAGAGRRVSRQLSKDIAEGGRQLRRENSRDEARKGEQLRQIFGARGLRPRHCDVSSISTVLVG